MIAKRRAFVSADAPRDLFELMVAARDPETGHAFNDRQLADQVATMILAGHETTATALFWALYLLALDQDTQTRVAAEATRAGPTSDTNDLPFTRAALDETLRLYPPAYLIARAAYGPDRVGDVAVARNDIVFVAPWLLHRHAKLWDDPHAFKPERFAADAPPHARFSYLPFGFGPRVCIGAQFALTEATLALARIIGAFEVRLADSRPVTPVGIVTIQPDHSPPFRLIPRGT
jgi:unspecific monooxygenase